MTITVSYHFSLLPTHDKSAKRISTIDAPKIPQTLLDQNQNGTSFPLWGIILHGVLTALHISNHAMQANTDLCPCRSERTGDRGCHEATSHPPLSLLEDCHEQFLILPGFISGMGFQRAAEFKALSCSQNQFHSNGYPTDQSEVI